MFYIRFSDYKHGTMGAAYDFAVLSGDYITDGIMSIQIVVSSAEKDHISLIVIRSLYYLRPDGTITKLGFDLYAFCFCDFSHIVKFLFSDRKSVV